MPCMRYLPLLCSWLFYVQAHSQNMATVNARNYSSDILRKLRGAAIVIRLKTSDKSIAAYRAAGKENIANRMVEENRKRNIKIAGAFASFFSFAKPYFIYAHQTNDFLKNPSGFVFMNEELKTDTSIRFTDSIFVFCEYGSAVPYSSFQEGSRYILGERNDFDTASVKQTTTTPSSSNVLVLLDKDLRQLQRPFPFVEGVYLDNFDASVRTLQRELDRAYMRLVVRKDVTDEIKKQKQKLKEKNAPH